MGSWRSSLRQPAGHLVAAALATAWRREPRPLDLEPEALARVAPLVVKAGAGALVWRRIRSARLRTIPAAPILQEVHRFVAAQTVLHRRQLVACVAGLRSAGIEPLLVKGWAIARLYPSRDLRPCGDMDLCVRRTDYRKARAALDDATGLLIPVDLHDGFERLDEENDEILFRRSVLVDCEGTAVRVLAPEDHLRLLCRHLLRHGVARPLWLCDVALALEERPSNFDWARCLGPSQRVADWVRCTVGLAHHLLDARVDGTPLDVRATHLPPWLVPTVLRQWRKGYRPIAPLAFHVRRPTRLVAEMPDHWPNGIQATVALRRSFNAWPRLPYQIGACLPGAVRFVRGAIGGWRSDRP